MCKYTWIIIIDLPANKNYPRRTAKKYYDLKYVFKSVLYRTKIAVRWLVNMII